MKKCEICGKTDMKTENYCELCAYLSAAGLYHYTTKQLMALYSNILGAKIIQEITDSTYSALKDQYDAEKTKKEGQLN